MQTKDELKKSANAPELFQRAIQFEGHWTATLRDEHGNYKTHFTGQNVITNSGVAFLAEFFASAAGAASTFTMKYIGMGTNTTAEAAANSTLGTESARQTGVVSYVSSGIFKVVATFAAGTGTGDITEYGVFSSSANGTMLNRIVQSAIAKGASDSLEVTCEITLSN